MSHLLRHRLGVREPSGRTVEFFIGGWLHVRRRDAMSRMPADADNPSRPPPGFKTDGPQLKRGLETEMAAEKAHTGVTLTQLAATGRHVVVQCGHCPNRRLSRTSDLGLPMDTPVNLVGALLKCCECGSTDVLVYPESNRDARRGRVR